MKKIMLLSIAFYLFACSGNINTEYKKDEQSKEETKAEYTEAAEGENRTEDYNNKKMVVQDASLASNYSPDQTKDGNTPITKEKEEVSQAKIDARIIKTANMKFQVLDVDEATRNIQKILKTKGAYISDMNQAKNRDHFYSDITIRVPNLYFEDVLNQLSLAGEKVDYKRISSQDVTEEYVDIQTRLKTKKEVKKRYEEILRNKAKTVAEVLETEEKLRVIQEEIEAQEGRLRYLHNQTSMSTIYLTIYEEGVNLEEVEAKKEFTARANKGFSAGWDAVLNVVINLTYMWPGLLITIAILIWQRRLVRKLFKGIKSLSNNNN